MKQPVLVMFLLLPLIAFADVVLGGAATTGFDVILASVTEEIPHYEATLALSFNINADSEYFTLAAEPGLNYNWSTGDLTFFLDRAELLLSPADFFSLVIGRFLYAPGTGEIFSATNYFVGTDYMAVLSGNWEKARIPNNMIQAKVFIRDCYFTFTAAPFHLQPVIPAPGSAWFPMNDLPQTLTYPPPINQVLTLGNLTVAEQAAANAGLDKISLAVEGGVQLPFLDCSLIFYTGDDNSLLLSAEMDFPNGLFGNYDIHLTPLQPTMTALGLNLAANIAALRLWSDVSCSFSRTFMTNRLSETNFTTIAVQSPYVEYIIGTSLEVEALNLILLAEYKNSHILQPADGMILPMLGSLFSCSAVLRLFNYTTQLRGLMLFSLADNSLAAGVSLSCVPVEEISIDCTLPFYAGAGGTLFGQYAANSRFTFTLTVRY